MKKHLLALMMLLTSFCSNAQYDSARMELAHIFQYIDKSQIPSGYLDEYGGQVVDKNWLNGVLTDSNRIYDLTLFRYLYNDLEFSKIYSAASTMTTLENVNSAILAVDTSASYSPLVFLIGQYSILKEDAIQQNLFSYSNNQIFDVSGRSQSPYLLKSLFAATPVDFISPVANTIKLKYVAGLSYSNCGKTIRYIWIDFLDGNGYQSLPANGTISKTYTDSSEYKQFVVKIQCSDNSVYYCYTGQFVRVENSTGRYGLFTELELKSPVKKINSVTGQHQEGRIYVRYSSLRNGTPLQGKMVKPLIIVEGYDINDGAPKLDATNYNVNDLIEEWDNISFGTNPQLRFTEHLDDVAGYDLVFVDYNTMDYVENNAIMLQKVIEWVNDEKTLAGSTEQNVVMGISLGGVLARYTLAKMTKNLGTNSTKTRLLITMDSPHQGANVPLGLQHFLYDLGEVTIVGRKLRNIQSSFDEFYALNSLPATQQLLLLRVTDANGTVATNSFISGDYRTMITFGTSDPSPSYTFIAVSQGSQCANWVMQPSATFLQKDGNVATANFLWYIFRSKYKITTEVKALPSYGLTSQISYLRFQRNIRLFYGLLGTGWKTTYGPVSRTSPANTIPWEAVPGGTQSLSNRSGGGFSDNSNFPLSDIDVSHNTILGIYVRLLLFPLLNVDSYFDIPFQQDIFTHVPITSALDVQNIASGTFNQQFIFPLTGLNGSRTSDYIAQQQFTGLINNQSATLYNLNHTDFTARNSEWLLRKMEAQSSTSVACSTANECFSSIYKIIGASAVCSTENYQVEFNGSAITSGITWSVSSNKPAALTATGGIATLTKNTNQNGVITLTASVTTTCGILNSTKQIQVGPTASVITGPYDASLNALVDPACVGDEYYFYANETSTVFPATSYTWTLYPPTGNPTLHSGVQPYVVFDEAGTHSMQVTKNTICGSITSQIEFDVQECLYGFNAYPNPSNSVLTIDPNRNDSASSGNYNRRKGKLIKKIQEKVVQKICVYDIMGRQVKTLMIGKAGLIRIDVSDLVPGIYIVEMHSQNARVQRKKILIQR